MIPTITASPDTLMQQAPVTVAGYLSAARRHIDDQFGQGYAEKNPALLAAFVQACAQDFETAMNAGTRQTVAGAVSTVSDSIDRVAAAIGDLVIG